MSPAHERRSGSSCDESGTVRPPLADRERSRADKMQPDGKHVKRPPLGLSLRGTDRAGDLDEGDAGGEGRR